MITITTSIFDRIENLAMELSRSRYREMLRLLPKQHCNDFNCGKNGQNYCMVCGTARSVAFLNAVDDALKEIAVEHKHCQVSLIELAIDRKKTDLALEHCVVRTLRDEDKISALEEELKTLFEMRNSVLFDL